MSLSAILKDLKRHREMFDLSKGLGEQLMNIAAEQIRREMDSETDPDGTPWPALSPAYAASKSSGDPMAVLYHHMKTDANIAGRRFVSPEECRMAFGQDEESMQEAEWFQEGNSRTGQPPRRFYALSIEALTRLDQHTERHFRKNV